MGDFDYYNKIEVEELTFLFSPFTLGAMLFMYEQSMCPGHYGKVIEHLKQDGNESVQYIVFEMERNLSPFNSKIDPNDIIPEDSGIYEYIKDLIYTDTDEEATISQQTKSFIVGLIDKAQKKISSCLHDAQASASKFYDNATSNINFCHDFLTGAAQEAVDYLHQNSFTIASSLIHISSWALNFVGPTYADLGVKHEYFSKVPILLSLKMLSLVTPTEINKKFSAGVNSFAYFHISKSFCVNFGPVKENGKPNYLSPLCMAQRTALSFALPIISQAEQEEHDFIYGKEAVSLNGYDTKKAIEKAMKKGVKEFSKIPFPEPEGAMKGLLQEVFKQYTLSYAFKSKNSYIDSAVALEMGVQTLAKIPLKRALQNNDLMATIADNIGIHGFITKYVPDFFEQLDNNYMWVSFAVSTIFTNSVIHEIYKPYFQAKSKNASYSENQMVEEAEEITHNSFNSLFPPICVITPFTRGES